MVESEDNRSPPYEPENLDPGLNWIPSNHLLSEPLLTQFQDLWDYIKINRIPEDVHDFIFHFYNSTDSRRSTHCLLCEDHHSMIKLRCYFSQFDKLPNHLLTYCSNHSSPKELDVRRIVWHFTSKHMTDFYPNIHDSVFNALFYLCFIFPTDQQLLGCFSSYFALSSTDIPEDIQNKVIDSYRPNFISSMENLAFRRDLKQEISVILNYKPLYPKNHERLARANFWNKTNYLITRFNPIHFDIKDIDKIASTVPQIIEKEYAILNTRPATEDKTETDLEPSLINIEWLQNAYTLQTFDSFRYYNKEEIDTYLNKLSDKRIDETRKSMRSFTNFGSIATSKILLSEDSFELSNNNRIKTLSGEAIGSDDSESRKKRGRPRKYPDNNKHFMSSESVVKRRRGRPRKIDRSNFTINGITLEGVSNNGLTQPPEIISQQQLFENIELKVADNLPCNESQFDSVFEQTNAEDNVNQSISSTRTNDSITTEFSPIPFSPSNNTVDPNETKRSRGRPRINSRATAPARSRGRPRKESLAVTDYKLANGGKKSRGRPRLHPVDPLNVPGTFYKLIKTGKPGRPKKVRAISKDDHEVTNKILPGPSESEILNVLRSKTTSIQDPSALLAPVRRRGRPRKVHLVENIEREGLPILKEDENEFKSSRLHRLMIDDTYEDKESSDNKVEIPTTTTQISILHRSLTSCLFNDNEKIDYESLRCLIDDNLELDLPFNLFRLLLRLQIESINNEHIRFLNETDDLEQDNITFIYSVNSNSNFSLFFGYCSQDSESNVIIHVEPKKSFDVVSDISPFLKKLNGKGKIDSFFLDDDKLINFKLFYITLQLLDAAERNISISEFESLIPETLEFINNDSINNAKRVAKVLTSKFFKLNSKKQNEDEIKEALELSKVLQFMYNTNATTIIPK